MDDAYEIQLGNIFFTTVGLMDDAYEISAFRIWLKLGTGDHVKSKVSITNNLSTVYRQELKSLYFHSYLNHVRLLLEHNRAAN